MADTYSQPTKDYPRHPEWGRYKEYHDKIARGDSLGIDAKFSTVIGNTGIAAGAGGDIVVPLPGDNPFGIGLGCLWYPSDKLGKTGFRFSAFLDFPRIATWARFRFGAFADMPMFGEIRQKYERIEGGVYSEVLATIFRLGPFRFGGSFMAGMGVSTKGLNFFIAPGVALEVNL